MKIRVYHSPDRKLVINLDSGNPPKGWLEIDDLSGFNGHERFASPENTTVHPDGSYSFDDPFDLEEHRQTAMDMLVRNTSKAARSKYPEWEQKTFSTQLAEARAYLETGADTPTLDAIRGERDRDEFARAVIANHEDGERLNTRLTGILVERRRALNSARTEQEIDEVPLHV